MALFVDRTRALFAKGKWEKGDFRFVSRDFKVKEAIDLDPRVTVLGHIQRGGTPTGRDRVNATKMGYLAVEMLLQGKTNRIVCTHQGTFTDVDIDEGLAMQKCIQKMEVDVLAAMTGI